MYNKLDYFPRWSHDKVLELKDKMEEVDNQLRMTLLKLRTEEQE